MTGRRHGPRSAQRPRLAKLIRPSLDIETQGFIDSIAGGKPLHMLSPGEAREVLSAVQELVEIDLAPAHVEDLELEVGPTGVTRVRICRPTGSLRQGLHRL